MTINPKSPNPYYRDRANNDISPNGHTQPIQITSHSNTRWDQKKHCISSTFPHERCPHSSFNPSDRHPSKTSLNFAPAGKKARLLAGWVFNPPPLRRHDQIPLFWKLMSPRPLDSIALCARRPHSHQPFWCECPVHKNARNQFCQNEPLVPLNERDRSNKAEHHSWHFWFYKHNPRLESMGTR